MDPNSVPISEALVDTNGLYVTEFTIGNDDDWLVEWKEIGSNDPPKLTINGNVGTERLLFHQNRDQDGMLILIHYIICLEK